MTLVLSRVDVLGLVPLSAQIERVEEAFRSHALGNATVGGAIHIDGDGGEFHVKGGRLDGNVAVKMNAGFFKNSTKGLPTIAGVIALCDATTGQMLALLDSAAITAGRTAAATAVAARYLSAASASTVTIVGAGTQARHQLEALLLVRCVKSVSVWSRTRERAEAFANQFGSFVTATDQLTRATSTSDIVVTATPSRTPLVGPRDVQPGAFIAAIGADSADKQELDPRLVARSAVVVDVLDQCIRVGELHHAVGDGLLAEDQVRGELGSVVAGLVHGRQTRDEVVIFDSTGTAFQDAAVAVEVYERAKRSGLGLEVDFRA